MHLSRHGPVMVHESPGVEKIWPISAKNPRRTLPNDSLCFSPGGDRLNFITSAWVMSGALHCVDMKTGNESFLTDASSVEIMHHR